MSSCQMIVIRYKYPRPRGCRKCAKYETCKLLLFWRKYIILQVWKYNVRALVKRQNTNARGSIQLDQSWFYLNTFTITFSAVCAERLIMTRRKNLKMTNNIEWLFYFYFYNFYFFRTSNSISTYFYIWREEVEGRWPFRSKFGW